ncbi:hypothetical protein AAG570_008705 [Ranatra chinensis]|uniref:Vacuolar ATPase assembly protein VMA22 n=1 Tax=Ranatra chinensis TaxID=642074 RepID=A0ABD0Z8S4_9HEMI
MESVCSELDELSVHMLYLMKEYIDCKVDIEDLVKSGSLHLAKSRYIMGNKSVSALQLPTEDRGEICAQTTLLTSKDKSGSMENITLELKRLSFGDSLLDKTSEGLKSRSKDKDQSPDCGESKKIQDPLKWFGVLVPQNLRHAQSCFNRAIDLVVQCVNIQLEMDSTKKKYEKYLKKKKLILAKKDNNDS